MSRLDAAVRKALWSASSFGVPAELRRMAEAMLTADRVWSDVAAWVDFHLRHPDQVEPSNAIMVGTWR